MALLALFLSLSFPPLLAATPQVPFSACGILNVQQVVADWVYFYTGFVPEFDGQFTFVSSPNPCVADAINSSGTNYFALSHDSPPDTLDGDGTDIPYRVFPLIALPISMQVNFPSNSWDPKNTVPVGSGPVIHLSRATLVDIYMRETSVFWDDPLIMNDNPSIAQWLPHKNITFIWRNGGQATPYLTQLLSDTNSTWNETWGPFETWPSNFTSRPNWFASSTYGTLNTFADGLSHPYSLAFVTNNYFTRPAGRVQWALIDDQHGNWVGPDTAGISEVMETANMTYENPAFLTGSIQNSPTVGAYPMAYFVYVYLQATNLTNCTQRREAALFLRWIVTSQQAIDRTIDDSFVPLTSTISTAVIKMLDSITCNGESLLQVRLLNQRNGVIFIFFGIIASFIFIAACGLTVLHLYNFWHSTVTLVYSAALLLGAVITFSAPIIWYLVPVRTSICLSRLWFTSLGFSSILGTMFSRTWQLREIYYIQKKDFGGLTQISVRGAMWKAALSISAITSIDFVFLLIWTLVDPYEARLEIVDEFRQFGKWTCSSSRLEVWMSLQVTFLAVLLVWGVFVIYETWSFQRKSVISETKWVLMSLYNVVLNGGILIPFLAYISQGDDDVAAAVLLSVDFSAGGIVLAVLGPSIYNRYFNPSQGSGGSVVSTKVKTRSPEISEKKELPKRERLESTASTHEEVQLLVVAKKEPLTPLSPHPEEIDSSSARLDIPRSDSDSDRHHSEAGVKDKDKDKDKLQWSSNPITEASSEAASAST